MSLSIHWQDKGVVDRQQGHLKLEDVLESVGLVHGDERFDDLRYQIIDLTGMTTFDFQDDDAHMVAALDRVSARTNPYQKIAIVVTQPAFIPLAQAYVSSISPAFAEARHFTELNEALAWAV